MRKKTFSAALAALPVLLGGIDAARADIEVGVFGGYKHYSTDNALGQPRNLPEYLEGGGTSLYPSGVLGLRVAVLPIPRLAIEGEIGVSPTGMRGSLLRRSPTQDDLDHATNTQAQLAVIPARVHLLINLLTGKVRPFLLVGGGGHISSPMSPGILRTDGKGALHAGGGIGFNIRPTWGLRFDGRIVLSEGQSQAFVPEGEALAAIWGHFGKLPPSKPPKPVEAKAPLAAEPTPAPPVATQPAPPPPPPTPPKPPEVKPVPPPAPPVDSDGDGVFDHVDKCPGQSGHSDNQGCPDLDTDSDGLSDRLDKCPTQVETKNGFQDDDGCPDELPDAVKPFTGTIAGVSFQPFSAVLTPPSLKILDQAAKALAEVPTLRIEIAGHTDPAGDPQKNRILSQQRAEAVKQYLIQKGIDASRLVAAGYGADKPRHDNATPDGRAKNRRVEFNVLVQ